MTATTLANQALALPIGERVEFAQMLWASIDGQLADVDAADALAEAKRRDAALNADPSIGQPHDEVMRVARQSLA